MVPLKFSQMRGYMYILTLDEGLNILNIIKANKHLSRTYEEVQETLLFL